MAGSNALIQFQPFSYVSQYTENANSNKKQNQLLFDNSIPYPNTVINPLKLNHIMTSSVLISLALKFIL
ncbi:2107_t:CDS:1, partial [Funneliformis mosseae]